MARKKGGSGDETPAPRKKDTRDRRDYQKDRRAEAARGRAERRAAKDPGWRGDKRAPEGRQAEDEAKIMRGYSKVKGADLQSPPGGTQREVWVKDPDPPADDEE